MPAPCDEGEIRKRKTVMIFAMAVVLGFSVKGAAAPLPSRRRVLDYVSFGFAVAGHRGQQDIAASSRCWKTGMDSRYWQYAAWTARSVKQ